MKAEGLASCLEAPVLGWRVLCAPARVRRKVKRDLQRFKFTPTPNIIISPPTQVHHTVKLEHSHIFSSFDQARTKFVDHLVTYEPRQHKAGADIHRGFI